MPTSEDMKKLADVKRFCDDVAEELDPQRTDFRDDEPQVTTYKIKDSGERAEFKGGMVRDTNEGKMRPDLVRDGPMFWRWVMHLTTGAKKYAARNWMKGVEDPATLERAYESADRHYEQWRRGDTDEDHAAAVFFNINQVEYYKEVAENASQQDTS